MGHYKNREEGKIEVLNKATTQELLKVGERNMYLYPIFIISGVKEVEGNL